MIKYLLCDYTGAASGRQYGKKDDPVAYIKDDGEMALVNNGKELFHIRLEKLTDQKPVKEEEKKPPDEEKKPDPIPVKTNPSPKKAKIKSTPAKQSKLF